MTTNTETRPREIAFAIPVLPGKTQEDREAMLSCWHGERQEAHRASRERFGITRESVWIQPTPTGDIAVVHMAADDIETALRGMGTSQEPFDRWFREYVMDVHGVDLTEPLPPLEQVLGYRH